MSGTKLREITKVVTTVQDVDIRTGDPARNGNENKKGILFEGFEIEVVEEWKGQEIDSNDRWYRDRNGDFLWSGGFESSGPETTDRKYDIDSLLDYSRLFKNIPEEWRSSRGEGVSVAVLDSGIFEDHRDFGDAFDPALFPSRDFTGSASGPADKNGHGSHVAGLIGARAAGAAGVCGIARSCRLWNVKVLDDNGGSDREWLKAAYAHLKGSVKPDVVNLSLSISQSDYERIREIFSATDFIQVAAAGNNGILMQSFDFFNYPAMDEHIISVGVIDSELLTETLRLNSRLDYLLIRESFQSCSISDNKYYSSAEDSSQAAALVSGLVALIQARFGRGLTLGEVKQKLDDMAMSVTDAVNNKTPYRLIKCH